MDKYLLDSFRDASVRIANSSSGHTPYREVTEAAPKAIYKRMDDYFFLANDLWFRCQVSGLAETITHSPKRKIRLRW